jgi:hypothetical protein
MTAAPKTGPYTQQELLDLWKSVTDPLYAQPLLDQGDGHGLEVFNQGIAQAVRVSEAIDRTTQAMFILPWSGQTNEPASGGERATVELTFTRSAIPASAPIVLGQSVILADEVTTDYADNNGVKVFTGRRYILVNTIAFAPGEVGPITVTAIAEQEGFGYVNPLPGTITAIDQPGASFANTNASITLGPTSNSLVLAPRPDVISAPQIGQYVRIVGSSTSNLNKVRRVVAYSPPGTLPTGGTAFLEKLSVLSCVSPSFIPGEAVTGLLSGATGNVIKGGLDYLLITQTNGAFLVGESVVGAVSASASIITAVVDDGSLVAETGVSWRMVKWDELGVAVTNPQSPVNGLSPMLDELGGERNIARAPGESDADYRVRVAVLPDVVSPNAIKRAANRVLAQYGIAVCYREVGDVDRLFPGMFYDTTDASGPGAYAFDLDLVTFDFFALLPGFIEGEVVTQIDGGGQIASGRIASASPASGVPPYPAPTPSNVGVVNVHGTFKVGFPIVGTISGATYTPTASVSSGLSPFDRFKLMMDYTEFRAFFVLGVPRLDLGDFGISFDPSGAQANAFDASPFYDFFDGFPLTAAVIYRSIWQSVEKVRAAGVTWDLYIENLGCF